MLNLAPVLKVKFFNSESATFSPLISVLSPLEIEGKNLKFFFGLGIYTNPNTLFLSLKSF
jgi:hypothetical protein